VQPVGEQELRRRRRARPAEDSEAELTAFQARHRSLSDRVERFLLQAVILGLVALVLVQTLLISPAIRRVANLTEGAEGVPVEQEPAWQAVLAAVADEPAGIYQVSVVLTNRPSAPDVALLVGGRKVGTFANPRLDAAVKPGQAVVVDASRHPGSLTFRVVGVQGLVSPELGHEVVTHGDRQTIGVARRAN
jgi:hypothetical protein